MYDIIVIGAGIIGSAITHQLAKYDLKVLVLEKDVEVANGVTKANSAVIHSGYDPKPGTLKARLNVRGNQLYGPLTKELNVHFERIGSITLAFTDEEVEVLHHLAEFSKQNGVDIEMLTPEEILKREPNVQDDVKLGLHAPSAGILAPWDMVYAFLENAVFHGTTVKTEQEVKKIDQTDFGFKVLTQDAVYDTKMVINCAGNHAWHITKMVTEDPGFTPKPTRGEYYVIDRGYLDYVHAVLFPTPTKKGKGVLILPTIHGNLLMGPTAEGIEDSEDTAVTKYGLSYVRQNVGKMFKKIPYEGIIRTFSGVRPKTDRGDFIIEEVKDVKNFIQLAGIESPGLASAPAIAEYVEELFIKTHFDLKLRENYQVYAKKPVILSQLPIDEINRLVQENPKYGNLVCHCEEVSEQEIIDCIKGPLGARTVDGVKRRTRPGAGRCQGSFCEGSVIRILSEVLKVDPTEIVQNNRGSNVLIGKTKEGDHHVK